MAEETTPPLSSNGGPPETPCETPGKRRRRQRFPNELEKMKVSKQKVEKRKRKMEDMVEVYEDASLSSPAHRTDTEKKKKKAKKTKH